MIDSPADAITPGASHTGTAGESHFRFVAHGIPAPQGSHKAFVVGGKARITQTNTDKHALWRNQVTLAAINAFDAHGMTCPLDGPLALAVEFRFPMPKSRRKADRVAGRIWKQGAPDLDKLIRSVGDSLTAAGVITDDARIAITHAAKYEVWNLWTGADVTVTTLEVTP